MHFLTKSLEERPINRSLRAQASTNHRNDTVGIAVLHQEVGRCVTEELAHRLDALHDRLPKVGLRKGQPGFQLPELQVFAEKGLVLDDGFARRGALKTAFRERNTPANEPTRETEHHHEERRVRKQRRLGPRVAQADVGLAFPNLQCRIQVVEHQSHEAKDALESLIQIRAAQCAMAHQGVATLTHRMTVEAKELVIEFTGNALPQRAELGRRNSSEGLTEELQGNACLIEQRLDRHATRLEEAYRLTDEVDRNGSAFGFRTAEESAHL